jgi:hypothetical protein
VQRHARFRATGQATQHHPHRKRAAALAEYTIGEHGEIGYARWTHDGTAFRPEASAFTG